ncbi:hypothetical protein CHU32_21680 [Superficieibacter electus]|uniref:Uncharacterized protein n=1 Tax=Superficieibacter electus TaxID=2022662 RepID=A0A2P5GJN0_9ENTR|nr:hypothetical protein [Superficieibacter electus]POP41878.1 hypothetical protein CHU33_21210 [Superficieibacter electus]POP44185.1 hypothetical protein CHU32_21680 [Superficieibacter electus]
MFRFIVALFASFMIMQSAFADTARPEIAKYVKGYQGQEGVQVWTLRIGPKEANESLVQIVNVDNALDKKIIRCKVEPASGGATSYKTEVEGKSWELLRVKDGSGELYLPGESSSTWVAYSQSLSQEGNAEHFLTDYLEQEGK